MLTRSALGVRGRRPARIDLHRCVHTGGSGIPLDGKCATTHWVAADLFRTTFPAVHLDPDVLYVDEGQILTSACVSAGLDLCLYMVQRDHGAAAGVDRRTSWRSRRFTAAAARLSSSSETELRTSTIPENEPTWTRCWGGSSRTRNADLTLTDISSRISPR